ncbi:hypothetical protein GGH19_001637, partial [Coemansia sp. RSA 1807]
CDKTESVPRITFNADLLSAAKARALRQALRNRLIWAAVELVLLLILLALLVFHSFRLHHRRDNTYSQWSSSWVMILLSVLLVVVALSMFVTFYHFRTRLAWIRDPQTTDLAAGNPQGYRQGGSSLTVFQFLRRDRTTTTTTLPPVQRQPWLNAASRNSRAWREMNARQRESSLSSIGAPGPLHSHFSDSRDEDEYLQTRGSLAVPAPAHHIGSLSSRKGEPHSPEHSPGHSPDGSESAQTWTAAELLEVRARERTFDGAYWRTSVGLFGASLVILRIFGLAFFPVGLVFLALGLGFLGIGLVRRRRLLNHDTHAHSPTFVTSGGTVVLSSAMCITAYTVLLVLLVRI